MSNLSVLAKTGTLKIKYVETDASQWQTVVLCAEQELAIALQFAYMVFKAFMKK